MTGRLIPIGGAIFVVSLICALIFTLWRPVFISTCAYGLLLFMIGAGMSDLLRQISDFFGNLVTEIGRLASWIVMLLIVTIMFDVVTRKIEVIKIMNAEITETQGFSVSFILQDLQWHMHGILLLMTLGFGYMLNAHVRVDIFREAASRRGQAMIETFGLVVLAVPFILVMIGFSWDLFYASYKGWEGSESMVGLGWRWIIKSFLIWGFCVALMAVGATLIRCLNYLYGDYEEQTIAEESLQFFTDNDQMGKLIKAQNQDSVREGGQ